MANDEVIERFGKFFNTLLASIHLNNAVNLFVIVGFVFGPAAQPILQLASSNGFNDSIPRIEDLRFTMFLQF